MGLVNIQKVSESGRALIVVVPKKIREIKEYSAGDMIEVNWGNIIKKGEVKKTKVEKLPEI